MISPPPSWTQSRSTASRSGRATDLVNVSGCSSSVFAPTSLMMTQSYADSSSVVEGKSVAATCAGW